MITGIIPLSIMPLDIMPPVIMPLDIITHGMMIVVGIVTTISMDIRHYDTSHDDTQPNNKRFDPKTTQSPLGKVSLC
jgi:hypothetical protein